jgi:hypothetical protein
LLAWRLTSHVGKSAAGQHRDARCRQGCSRIDGLDAEDEAIVAALVPPVPRWIIKHVLIRGCRPTMFRASYDL